ncbi:YceI family protein [Xanthomonas campestris]|uniref:YceI family protein n=1 Tax=Xanthomonas campestris TaxID=339 RepID=UPI001D1526A2|nr:YceI family protein [Xanthomonas campestris]MCC3254136.1 YceI family protein [Xanthomonas campestris pv. armoraciae]
MPLSLRWVAWLALWVALPCVAQQKVHAIDPVQSRFGFEIRTRFGMKIEGLFPRFRGELTDSADGRQQVRFRLDAAQVEIPGKDRYTAWMRGEDFFNVAQYPVVEFESFPYSAEVVKRGGEITGNLAIRGITHVETLHVVPAECARPGYDCDVISRGTVLRGRYGMNAWQMALGDRVTFILRGRLQEVRRP